MKRKKIAIIGASYLQLPLVQKASLMGIETHCFAHDKDAVCKDYCTAFYPISVLEKEVILTTCKSIEIDGICTIASDVSVATVNFVAAELNLTANPIASTLFSTNKFKMKEALRKNNIRVANFSHITSLSEPIPNFSFPVIVKPVDRSGSLGVNKVDSEADLTSSIKEAIGFSLCHEAIIEEFITGLEVSVESISYKGKHYFLAVTDKETSGSPHFVETEQHEPSQFSSSTIATIKEMLPKILDALGIKNGASHTELIITPDGTIYVTEVGARMGGDFIGSHLVVLSTGYDFLKGVIDVSLNQFEAPVFVQSKFAGVLFLTPNQPVFPESILNNPNVTIVEHLVFSEPSETLKKSADRHGYLIYQSDKKISLISR